MAKQATPLSGHAALITGAASGIGRACALELARAGANVAINHLPGDDHAAEAVAAEAAQSGAKAVTVAADVTDEVQVRGLMETVVDAFGTLHLLVNNAGIQRDSAFAEMTLEQWRQVMDTNLTGQFLCARAAVREFRRRGPDPAVTRALGKIVCMSSVHEFIPWAEHANYAASKGGVGMLVRSLAQELAPERIRVNGVAPGAIRTPINRQAWDSDEALDRLLTLIPYGRIGEPEDVAGAVRWLASDDSDYVTGISLVVDGGMVLYPSFGEGGG